jgi:hypothetical protein
MPMELDFTLPSAQEGNQAAALTAQRRRQLWSYGLTMVSGAWLIAAASAFAYGVPAEAASGVARITAERGLPDAAVRGTVLFWSDLLSGVLLVVLGGLSLSRRYVWAPWAACIVGLWLLFAPLVLWAPTAAVYFNDTLIGSLVIAFAVLIPGVPGGEAVRGTEVPPGWNYNPSAWLQRAPIIAFAFLGFFLSRYLAAYQLGHLPAVWDPFFPDGTRRVLDSDISLAWPVSDAGLGAISYMLEALSGFIGGTRRWRTMPWMVLLFGVLVVPLGVVSIVLIILQPLAVGAWCTLCLVTAAAMLLMISPAVDEVIATCQFLAQSRRAGKPFWRTFWKGDTLDVTSEVPVPPTRSVGQELLAATDLDHVPWNLAVCAALGVWLMAAPAVLQTQGAAAGTAQLVGALVVTFAVIAFGEVARTARFLVSLLGAWLIVAPWLFAGGTATSTWNEMVVGVALLLLSLPRGKVTAKFGGWDRYIV